jgi:predicted dehydrogenase
VGRRGVSALGRTHPVRAAVVGFGAMGSRHAETFERHDGFHLVATVDPAADRRAIAAERHSVPVFACLDEMLNTLRVDLVAVCSPPAMHLDHVRLAVTSGCHVMCEKPVVQTVADATLLVEIASERNTCIYPAHLYKFSAVARLLRTPGIGTPKRGFVHLVRPSHAEGIASFAPDWRRNRAISGGGILADHGIHQLYLAPYVVGMGIDAVSCIGGMLTSFERRPREWSSDVEDTVVVRMTLGGVQWTVTLSWKGAARETTYALFGSSGYVEIGDDGSTICSRGDVSTLSVTSLSGARYHENLLPIMLGDVLHALRTPKRWPRLLDEIVACSHALQLCYESMAHDGAWLRARSLRS